MVAHITFVTMFGATHREWVTAYRWRRWWGEPLIDFVPHRPTTGVNDTLGLILDCSGLSMVHIEAAQCRRRCVDQIHQIESNARDVSRNFDLQEVRL